MPKKAVPKFPTAKKRIAPILAELARLYPNAECALVYANPLQLLVATILSAQCTDKRVNLVAPALFARYPTATDFANSDLPELEGLIRTTGFFHNKAKNIKGCCTAIVEQHGGEVPRTREELEKLPGVGRKTANVVLNTAFGKETMAVDTHIFRVANRTGLAPGKTPYDVEMGLLKRVPKEYLADAHHWLILHGRYVCVARTPRCWQCAVIQYCDYQPKTPPP